MLSKLSKSILFPLAVFLCAGFVGGCEKESAVEWVSLDPSIAKVDIYGLVTAMEAGSTTIMARSNEIVAECSITVNPLIPEGITLDKEVLDLKIGETAKLTATVVPELADGGAVE